MPTLCFHPYIFFRYFPPFTLIYCLKAVSISSLERAICSSLCTQHYKAIDAYEHGIGNTCHMIFTTCVPWLMHWQTLCNANKQPTTSEIRVQTQNMYVNMLSWTAHTSRRCMYLAWSHCMHTEWWIYNHIDMPHVLRSEMIWHQQPLPTDYHSATFQLSQATAHSTDDKG